MARHLLFIFVISATMAASVSGNMYNDLQITWGDWRGQILNDGSLLTLALDNYSGSGFQSYGQFLFAKISVQIKLVPNNSAGTVTAFYMSSKETTWDEIDWEFLGNLSGQPYVVHTNVYTQGKGNREQQFYLWFDPTADFHTYTIVWNKRRILFYVDDVPIRKFMNLERVGVPFPKNQWMRIYSSLWNADNWATRGGLVKIDWTQSPFTASFRNFSAETCYPATNGVSSSFPPCTNQKWLTQDLDANGTQSLLSVQKNYMIYNYCSDLKRFPNGRPKECKYS